MAIGATGTGIITPGMHLQTIAALLPFVRYGFPIYEHRRFDAAEPITGPAMYKCAPIFLLRAAVTPGTGAGG